MTLNTLSYIIYAIITIYITVVVGYMCYKNGYVYVYSIFKTETIAESINNILLLGYYLINIGYTITIVSDWKTISTVNELLDELSIRVSSIVFILAIMHYANIITLSFWRKTTN